MLLEVFQNPMLLKQTPDRILHKFGAALVSQPLRIDDRINVLNDWLGKGHRDIFISHNRKKWILLFNTLGFTASPPLSVEYGYTDINIPLLLLIPYSVPR